MQLKNVTEERMAEFLVFTVLSTTKHVMEQEGFKRFEDNYWNLLTVGMSAGLLSTGMDTEECERIMSKVQERLDLVIKDIK